MAGFEEFNEKEARDKLLKLMVSAKSCDQQDLATLEMHFEQIKEYSEYSTFQGNDTEMLIDIEDEVAEIINDSNFREDKVGLDATKCEVLLQIVHKYLAVDDPNIEVVLACNPFIPKDVLDDLIVSESYWEEDGTQQALARNRKEAWILEKLAQSNQEMTRYEVALNDATPANILAKLVQDTGKCDWRVEEIKFGEVSQYRGFVRWAVIQNQNTPKSILEDVVSGKLPALGADIDSVLAKIAKAILDE